MLKNEPLKPEAATLSDLSVRDRGSFVCVQSLLGRLRRIWFPADSLHSLDLADTDTERTRPSNNLSSFPRSRRHDRAETQPRRGATSSRRPARWPRPRPWRASPSRRSTPPRDNTIQVALVGCGGRGTGAAANALSTKSGPIKLVAMADVFEDRLDDSYEDAQEAARATRSTCPTTASSSASTPTRRRWTA